MSADKTIYKKDQEFSEGKVTNAGLVIKSWTPLGTGTAILTIVVNGRDVAGSILTRGEVRDLTRALAKWDQELWIEEQKAQEEKDEQP